MAEVNWENTSDAETPLKWYENGKYVIMPARWWYRIWLHAKATLYLVSLYELVFEAAFHFQQDARKFKLVVDFVQLVDIILTFLTAYKIRELSDYA